MSLKTLARSMNFGSLVNGTMKSGFTTGDESGSKTSAYDYLFDTNLNHW